ncbi:MAG: N-6 DNA methylase [Pirellulales bacterium]|nr:N-6 DNA methylase [Pirellulales bacterium]
MDRPCPPICETASKRPTAEDLARRFGPRSPALRICLPGLLRLLSSPQSAAAAEGALGGSLGGGKFARCENSLDTLARRIDAGLNRFPALHFLWALKLYYAAIVRGAAHGRSHCNRDHLMRDFPADWAALFRSASEVVSPALREGWPEIGEIQGTDLFQRLYQDLIPRPVRHVLGEYYTPEWLVEHVLDQLPLETIPDVRVLDPACGSGAFLLGVIRRLRRLPHPETLWHRVRGIDVNPLAVLTARANVFLALEDVTEKKERDRPLFAEQEQGCSPIVLGDSILDRLGGTQSEGAMPTLARACSNSGQTQHAHASVGMAPGAPSFDVIVGNPPWIAWDNLPAEYREATKPLWEKYGLFSLSATEARHGGGKKDLSMLMLYAAADRYLKPGGRLALVITQTLFQTQGAGDGFRRFRLSREGAALRVLRVDDFVEARPFGDAANWTSVIYLEKGNETRYPVKYVKWRTTPGKAVCGLADDSSATAGGGFPEDYLARPIDPQKPTSPWLLYPDGDRKTEFPHIGPSQYRAYLGANSGGLNGVFWLEILEKTAAGVRVRNVVERGKCAVESVETLLEPDLLFPLLRWSELRRYAAAPQLAILLVQDPDRRSGLDEGRLQAAFPHTYAYLRQFETPLRARSAYRRYQSRGPFYSMYNVGPYTLAPFKVVWRRMDRRVTATAVAPCEHPLLGRKPVVPQETCVLIPCLSTEETHYLCALLNSRPIDALIRALSVRGGKGFGTPRILDYLALQHFDPDRPLHTELAALSRQAHRLQEDGENIEEVQRKMDELAEKALCEKSVL